jgi:hypothetical protein
MLEKKITDAVTKSFLTMLAQFFASGGLPATSPGVIGQPSDPVEEESKYARGDRFFSEEKPTEISPELLDPTTKAFAKRNGRI